MQERLQKIIANSGYCSRRKAEELIEKGKVKLNNTMAKLGDKATEQDKITINNQELKTKQKNQYYILNKPKGILVTKSDPQNRRTIYNLKSVSKNIPTLNYVGRLDAMSEGLLILTNDGEFNNRLTHPSHEIKKTYQVRTKPEIKKEDIKILKNGLPIDNKPFFAKIDNINKNTFEITIQEGRNRIIRRALEENMNYKIYELKRISIGNIKLGNLKIGEIKEISNKDL
ncbi:MAG: rRNA pseudouridine synthase [Nanoarchaeota archaeon]|nr:rRNA pseudouridine synthase [Nanoarchaeota archaeon]